MFSLVEAVNYRCLRRIRRPLSPFQVLVGPNGSGKTTFLDVISFLGRLVSDGIEAAILERTEDFEDLVWKRSGDFFELAVEAAIPQEHRTALPDSDVDTIRYQVRVELDLETGEPAISAENVFLKHAGEPAEEQRSLFPDESLPFETIIIPTKSAVRTIVSKAPNGNANFYPETALKGSGGWMPSFKLGPRRSALANLPEDETRFPVATWLKGLLSEGVQQFVLNSLAMRNASPRGRSRRFLPDGSNLPWVIEDLRNAAPDRFRGWVDHLKTALEDLDAISTCERADDKRRYLELRYANGLRVPSWLASDGTLRLLAMTLPAYLSGISGVYLVEEPENGVHPRAVEAMFQSLSSVYDAQVLLATHSPVILGLAEPHQVLCFAKTEEGATDVVRGDKHPHLADWRGETSLGVLFASGVLG